jgi:hypothetical protein
MRSRGSVGQSSDPTREPAGQTVTLRLDGKKYVIYLGQPDADELRRVVESYVAAARRVQLGRFRGPRQFLRQYFGSGEPAKIDDAREGLLNSAVGPHHYDQEQERYRGTIFEQYKICVEMADRVSARRAMANTFFLTFNSAIFTLVGVFWKDRPDASVWLLTFPVAVLFVQCLAWFWLLRSYRQLNSGKYAVIGALEELLPTSPYWKSEWRALGRGADKSKYWSLTHIEQWVPLLFALAYLGAFAALLALT